MNRNKLRTLVAGGAAVAVLGIAGFAWAAFTYSPTAEANGAAKNFDPVTVTVLSNNNDMLPGDSKNVVLKLSNPNTSTNAKVMSITPAGVDVLQGSLTANTPEAKAYCESMVIQQPADGGNAALPTLGFGDLSYTLNNGVKFDAAMDIRCEGMTYKTLWTVVFQAA